MGDDDKIASKNFIVAALRLLTTNFSQEVTYSFVLKYYYYTILHTIECLKKNHKFFFPDADVFEGSLEACRKKNYCIKNQNRSSSRENYRKKNCSPVFCSSNDYFAQNFCFFFSVFVFFLSPYLINLRIISKWHHFPLLLLHQITKNKSFCSKFFPCESKNY